MRALFRPLGRGLTYRRLAYLLLGLPLGVFYFVFLVTAISAGSGLLVVWVGVLVLGAALLAWRAMGHVERALLKGMVGTTIESPPSPIVDGMTWWERTKAIVTDSYTWRSFAWLLIRFPLGIAGFVIAVVAITVPLSLLAAPVVEFLPETWNVGVIEGERVAIDVGTIDLGWIDDVRWWLYVAPVLGIIALPLAAHVVSGFGALHGLIATPLLGPSWRQSEATLRRRAEVAEQRTQLAHELHDSVGHTLTMMVVQAGAGAHVFEEDPEFARGALLNIEASGRQALGELDRILGILRQESEGAERAPQPGLEQVETLVAELRATGLPVELRQEGLVTDAAPDVGRSAYRIIQEALTNVVKHAGSVPTTVNLHRSAGSLELEVVNEAGQQALPGPDLTGGGRGLAGIRERVAMLGGIVESGPRPGGGFRVWARLPVEGT